MPTQTKGRTQTPSNKGSEPLLIPDWDRFGLPRGMGKIADALKGGLQCGCPSSRRKSASTDRLKDAGSAINPPNHPFIDGNKRVAFAAALLSSSSRRWLNEGTAQRHQLTINFLKGKPIGVPQPEPPRRKTRGRLCTSRIGFGPVSGSDTLVLANKVFASVRKGGQMQGTKQFQLDDDTHRSLTWIAEQLGISISEALTEAIEAKRRELARHQQAAGPSAPKRDVDQAIDDELEKINRHHGKSLRKLAE